MRDDAVLRRLGTQILILGICAAPLQAQREGVSLTAVAARMNTVSDKLMVRAFVRAPTAIDVNSVVLELPAEFALPPRAATVTFQDAQGATEFSIDNGRREISAVIPALGTWTGLRLLFFRAGEYKLKVQLNYETAAGGAQEPLEVAVPVEPRAPFAAIISSGAIGVIVVLVVTLLIRKAKHIPGPSLKDYGVLLGLGLVLVIALSFAARYWPEAGNMIGVDLDIRDFRGGFVIGITFQTIAKAVAERLGIVEQLPKGNH